MNEILTCKKCNNKLKFNKKRTLTKRPAPVKILLSQEVNQRNCNQPRFWDDSNKVKVRRILYNIRT